MTDLSDDEILACVRDWLAGGRVGSLEDAVRLSPVSRQDAFQRRNRLLRQLYARFDHKPEHERLSAAYDYLTLRSGRPNGGQSGDARKRLAREIFEAVPQLISRRRFRQIVTGK